MAQRARWNMIGGVGSVRGLTLMIATEGIFVWRAVTPTSALKHCQQHLCTVPTLSTRRFENVGSPGKLNRVFFVIGNPLKVDFLLSRATCVDAPRDPRGARLRREVNVNGNQEA
jgi:hypothetical protein